MQNGLQVFTYEGNEVRTVRMGGDTWWVLKDVCDILSLSNSRIVADRLDEDDVSQTYITDSLGRQQQTSIVNESGLYCVILRSDKPEAKKFKRWVTHEVLPTIRKQGCYSTGNQLPLDQVMEIVKLTATTILTEFIKQMTPILRDIITTASVSRTGGTGHAPQDTSVMFDDYAICSKCKLETFPVGLREQVDVMLEDMRQQQTLNFSMIARYCTMSGYPISQPAVKRYFVKHYED
jgi:prophage antirepressor-like protein